MEANRLVNSEMSDKMAGMDFVEKLMRVEGLDLRSILWVREDEKGHQWFSASVTVVLPASSK